MTVDKNTSGKQNAAEADVEGFRNGLGPFVVAAETTRMPMMFTNAKALNNPVIFVNQAFLTLTGYDEHEILGKPFDSLMDSNTGPEASAELQTAFDGGRDLETSVRYRRKNGINFWVTIFISPVRDEDGGVVQHFASFVDITQRKSEEDLNLKLMVELNQLKQSTLASVLTIAEQTLRGGVDGQAVDRFFDRLASFSTEPSPSWHNPQAWN